MQKLGFVCVSQVLLCKSQVRHAKARFVMQKLGFAQLSCYIPATSMVYRPFCGYLSLFKSQYIIIFQCILCKLCWSRAMFYYVPATLVVYRPFGGYPSLFKSQYIIIFQCILCNFCCSTHCGMLCMLVCIDCKPYVIDMTWDLGWVGVFNLCLCYSTHTHVCIEQREDKVDPKP